MAGFFNTLSDEKTIFDVIYTTKHGFVYNQTA